MLVQAGKALGVMERKATAQQVQANYGSNRRWIGGCRIIMGLQAELGQLRNQLLEKQQQESELKRKLSGLRLDVESSRDEQRRQQQLMVDVRSDEYQKQKKQQERIGKAPRLCYIQWHTRADTNMQ